jgi:hypothetical protein
MPSIAITSKSSRSSLFISALFSSCNVPAQEGERDALTRRQQDRCHVFSNEKSNKTRRKSHGFESSRTLSCERATKEFSHKKAQKHKWLLNGRRSINNHFVLFVPLRLTSYGDTQRADVAARVKSPQRDCVFAWTEAAEVDRINFVAAVGDTVIRKYR